MPPLSFPNLANKHPEQPLFTPRAFMEYQLQRTGQSFPDPPPRALLMCYSPSLMKRVRARYNTKPVLDGAYELLDGYGDEIAVCGGHGIGAPMAATRIEELIAIGISEFISLGTAGSLQPTLGVGDFVICDRALRDEGVSHHYLPPARFAEACPKMVERIRSAFARAGHNPPIGPSWTIDAPYRETVREVLEYRAEGVLTVEMEAAALHAVALHRGVSIASAFCISDLLTPPEWKPHFHNTKAALDKLFEVCLDAVVTRPP